MENWPQNLRFCIFDLHFAQFLGFLQLSELLQPTMLWKVHFLQCLVGITIFSVHLWIYRIPNGKLASKLTILYFLPPFSPKFSLFATSRASTTYLCLANCEFGMGLFVKPFFLSIYVFTVFQMAHWWPQNRRFCIVYLHFAQKVALLAPLWASISYL